MEMNDDETIILNRQQRSSYSSSSNRNNESQYYIVFITSLIVIFISIIVSAYYNILPECLFKFKHTTNTNENVYNDMTTIRSLNNDLTTTTITTDNNGDAVLNDTNQTYTTIQQIPSKQTLLTLYSTKYEFISSLSTDGYFGKYSNLQMKHDLFRQNHGDVELFFYKIKQSSTLDELIQNNTLKAVFILKDDHYIDKFVKANFTVYLPDNFTALYADSITHNKSIELNITNTKVDYIACEYLSNFTNYNSNSTSIHLTFHNKQRTYTKAFDSMLIVQFSQIDIVIKSKNFSVTLNVAFELDEASLYKIRNYSFMLTVLCIVELYYKIDLLNSVADNSQHAMDLDMLTIGVNLVYKGFITTANFYLSINTIDGINYEYAIPSFLYFVSFSVFEFRLLFLVWRVRYTDLLFTNREQFKYKLIVFYLNYYVVLFVSLMIMRFIITNTICCFVLFTATWLFQVVHSVRTGTKPPMQLDYILVNTLIRLYLPVYLKAYNANAFELRPSYAKVFGVVCIVLVEMGLLMIQRCYGGKVIIPRYCKALPFNYYTDDISDEKYSSQVTCAICLEMLVEENSSDGRSRDEEVERIKIKNRRKVCVDRIKKVHCVEVCRDKMCDVFNPRNQRKKYMVTPCEHVFHNVCLEEWIKIKSECPCCRRRIPCID